MIKATKIRMKAHSKESTLLEIKDIYLIGCDTPNWYSKESIHDFIKKNNGKVYVDISPYPLLTAEISQNGEKYVKSTPNAYQRDNLLSLPTEK